MWEVQVRSKQIEASISKCKQLIAVPKLLHGTVSVFNLPRKLISDHWVWVRVRVSVTYLELYNSLLRQAKVHSFCFFHIKCDLWNNQVS